MLGAILRGILGSGRSVARPASGPAPAGTPGWLGVAETNRRSGSGDAALEVLARHEEAARDPRARILAGSSHLLHDRLDAAIDCFRAALVLEPDRLEASAALGEVLLAQGAFAEGWRYLRIGRGGQLDVDDPVRVRERIEDAASLDEAPGLVVRCSGRVEDILLHASLLEDLRRRAVRCLVEVPSNLAGIVRRSFPGIGVAAADPSRSGRPNDSAVSTDLVTLAALWRPDLDSFPIRRSWLVPDQERVEHWKRWLGTQGSGLKLGYWLEPGAELDGMLHPAIWTGLDEVLQAHPDAVPFPLAEGLPVAGPGRAAFRADTNAGTGASDLDELAAFMAALDLLVLSPGLFARLAGAVGAPAWIVARGIDWTAHGQLLSLWQPSARRMPVAEGESVESVRSRLAEGIARQARGMLALTDSTGASVACVDAIHETLRRDDFASAAHGCWFGLERSPDDAILARELASLAGRLGNTRLLLQARRWACLVDPSSAGAWIELADGLRADGCDLDAERALQRAVSLDERRADAWAALGELQAAREGYAEAVESYARALALLPGHGGLLLNQGLAFHRLGRLDDARRNYEAVLAGNPQSKKALILLAGVHVACEQPEPAEALYRRVLELDPGDADAWFNLGTVLHDFARARDAIECYRRALALEPANARTPFRIGLASLMLGDFAQGWSGYEARFEQPRDDKPPVRRTFGAREWGGESLADRSIVVWCEQGIGDQILFAGLIPELVERSFHCVIECAPKLVSLFARSFPSAEVVPVSHPPHPSAMAGMDFQVPSGTLARHFRPSLAAFSASKGYLAADRGRIDHWRSRLGALGDGPRVGICWRSSNVRGDRARACTRLDQWGEVFAARGAVFVCLQYDECAAEVAESNARTGVTLHRFPEVDMFDDLDETAALICALDLVISAPTSVSILSAALGVTTWQMHYGPYWQAHGTAHNPWFPALQRFDRFPGQPWEGVLSTLARRLESFSVGGGH